MRSPIVNVYVAAVGSTLWGRPVERCRACEKSAIRERDGDPLFIHRFRIKRAPGVPKEKGAFVCDKVLTACESRIERPGLVIPQDTRAIGARGRRG